MSENLIKESSYAIDKAAKILNKGGLVSVKAETVYGLACDPGNSEAILKLYNLKNRPSSNPLIIHVSSLGMLKDIAEINTITSNIINFFWPGPLTLILPRKKNKNVLDFAVSGLDTVAVRMPSSEIFLKVIKKFGWSFRLAGFDALNYCLLAEGKVDAVIEANLKPYDILPLIPIIKNSGAIVTNWKNEPAENGGNILATSNKILHNKILDLLKPFTKK